MSRTLPFSIDALPEMLRVLAYGGVLIVPTDTVYGLVCHPDYPEALERIRQMKGRDKDKPFQLLAASVENVREMGALQSATAEHFARFWPGALTLVLTCESGIIEGFRVPNGEILVQLLQACGGYLRATSVNLSGEPPATSLAEVPAEIQTSVDLILEGGALPEGEASTVIQVTPTDEVRILREGALCHQEGFLK
jgi:tRNA threonylcarbamoyl adenosine modification protein (Sua5/YciO/YrdC/YwlC family)